jgi:hypothetical protein
MAELDYGSILAAGQGLVGDLQQQMFLGDQRKMQAQAQQLQIAAAREKQARTEAFRIAAQQAAHSADPKMLSDLMFQYPEFADQIRPKWQSLSDEARRRNLTQTGTVFMRAKSGDAKGAAALLRQRYDADLAAGQADEITKELIDALESGDPTQVQQATATVGMLLAADDPSKFAETYGKLFPSDSQSGFAKEYADRVRIFGKKAADDWVKVNDAKVFSVAPGGSIKAFKADTTGALGASGVIAGTGDVRGFGGGTFSAGGGTQMTPQTAEGGDQSTGAGGPNGNGTLTQAQFQAIVGTLGKKGALEYVQREGLTVGGVTAAPRYTATQTVSGTTYYQIDGRWFDNPEGR